MDDFEICEKCYHCDYFNSDTDNCCPGEDKPCFEYSGPILENIDGYVSKDDLYRLIFKMESQLILNTAQATVLCLHIKDLPSITICERSNPNDL